MSFCNKCGKELPEGAAFCVGCGAPAKPTTPAPDAFPVLSGESQREEERTFLEITHRLLRWERTAWSITSKVYIIMGIVVAAIYMLFALIGLVAIADGDSEFGIFFMGMGFTYAIILGGMLIALGIVNKKSCQKLPQYIDTVYTDFSLAYNRCSNVGMLVFTVLFGAISPIFFIINFVRMKSCPAVIERIMKNQNVQG